MSDIAWSNMVYAMPTSDPFIVDLARAVTNDNSADGAAAWLLSQVVAYRRDQRRAFDRGDKSFSWDKPECPIAAYDFAIWDIEALCRWWPAFRSNDRFDADTGAMLARFLVDRLPIVWSSGVCSGPSNWDGKEQPAAPATLAVAAADRIDNLVCMFSIGEKPSGSKDPLALRRAAKEFLQLILPSVSPYWGRA